MTNPSIEELIRVLVRDELQRELSKTETATKPPASYVSVSEYAKARSISISTVRNAIRDGRLPAMKIGAAVRIRSDEEIGRPVTPSASAPTASQIAERIIAKQHKGRRLVAV
jgi:excisionase family DNA binding protein